MYPRKVIKIYWFKYLCTKCFIWRSFYRARTSLKNGSIKARATDKNFMDPWAYEGSSVPWIYEGSSVPWIYEGSSVPWIFEGSSVPWIYEGSSKKYLDFFSLECNISHTTIKQTLLKTSICLLLELNKYSSIPFLII